MSLLIWNPDLDGIRQDGRDYGYPECCVEAFVNDIANHRLPGDLRGIDATGEYVPCQDCLDDPDEEEPT